MLWCKLSTSWTAVWWLQLWLIISCKITCEIHIVELMCHQRRFHKCVTGNYFYFSILMLWSFSVNTFCLAVKSNKKLWHLMCLNISDKYVFLSCHFPFSVINTVVEPSCQFETSKASAPFISSSASSSGVRPSRPPPSQDWRTVHPGSKPGAGLRLGDGARRAAAAPDDLRKARLVWGLIQNFCCTHVFKLWHHRM